MIEKITGWERGKTKLLIIDSETALHNLHRILQRFLIFTLGKN